MIQSHAMTVMAASGTTSTIADSTQAIIVDDNSSGRTSLFDSSSAATSSLRSANSTPNITNDGTAILVYNYKIRDFMLFSPDLQADYICLRMCRELGILPTTRLLFNLRVHDAEDKWVLPGERLECGRLYAFRMRFKVPDLDTQLELLDANSHDYLYYQMRYDMQHENISEIRYPMKKDNVMGLAVVDMAIDMLEKSELPQRIEKDYKNYLPRKLLTVHRIFVKPRICNAFRELRSKPLHLGSLKWHYVHELYNLAPKYLMEQFKAVVENLPDEAISNITRIISSTRASSQSTLLHGSNSTLATTTTTLTNGHHNPHHNHQNNNSGSSRGSCDTHSTTASTIATSVGGFSGSVNHHFINNSYNQRRSMPGIPVNVKLSMHDSTEPGLKIATITSEDKQKWMLVAKIEEIIAVYEENDQWLRLEVNGFPKGYRLQFEHMHELQSFISYLGGYMRLSKNWMLDLCVRYLSPTLEDLKNKLNRCHGPIGGSYSFAIIREKRDECGSYIMRQCEKEYDVYYIDINNKSYCNGTRERCQTETFQVRHEENKWILIINGQPRCFDQLADAVQFIPCETKKFRIPPSDYDKPPLLLICLPKNLKSKKTETELSEIELQRRPAQIFDPKSDLQWYINSIKFCDDCKMFTYRADWIQHGSIKDVPVTLKVLYDNEDFPEFMKLANSWSLIKSPQFIKAFGLTLSTPFTMVMEHSRYGPLKDFLYARRSEVSMLALLDVLHGLVRGMHYLQDNNLVHSNIRCSNLFVTKYDPRNNVLEAKISDPGLPRSYPSDILPWIPFEYYSNIEAAKNDPGTQLWAFATTVWEIFARGRPLGSLSAELLHKNFNRFGGILEPLDESLCPKEMYEIMMDGWTPDDPDKRFNHQLILATLNEIQNSLLRNYTECTPDTCSTNGDPFEFETFNGNYNGSIMNLTFSNNALVEPNFVKSTSTTSKSVMVEQLQHNQNEQILGQHFASRNYFKDIPSVLQISDGKVIYKEKDKIGQGHYGTVYRGEIRYNDPKRAPEQVAIKKLKSSSMKKLNDDFEREIKIMQAMDHPNVVKFKYWIDQPISIVMEYFEYGSFTVYLTSRKPNLTNEKLLRFALDIAEGMNYLRSKEVIHRDLAARNILVDRDCVKISDFGLAQIADADGYYIARSVREIPIKWYSPESIKTSKFSFQSDVWSYGVTLFEMFSRGEIPNLLPGKDLTQEEFLNMLERGERLRQPLLCPDIVYEQLMRPCWHENPKQRPTFKKIIEIIKGESGESV